MCVQSQHRLCLDFKHPILFSATVAAWIWLLFLKRHMSSAHLPLVCNDKTLDPSCVLPYGNSNLAGSFPCCGCLNELLGEQNDCYISHFQGHLQNQSYKDIPVRAISETALHKYCCIWLTFLAVSCTHWAYHVVSDSQPCNHRHDWACEWKGVGSCE